MEGLPKHYKELCIRCNCTFGSHHGGTSPWPRDYCPGHEGRMDWENGPGTVFKGSGVFKGNTTIGRISSKGPNLQNLPKEHDDET